MQNIKRYPFFKTKYGDELLIDVVELKNIKKYLSGNPIHTLNYYDITLITKGEGWFRIDDKEYSVKPGDVIFSQPQQIRAWDTENISNGYALIFEGEFLLNFFNDQHFLEDITYFSSLCRHENKLTPDQKGIIRLTKLILSIKQEIDAYKQKDKHILRALLYQTLKVFDRIYTIRNRKAIKRLSNRHVDKFMKLVEAEYKQQHYVQYYAGKICITSDHLNEVVKQNTGYTAKQIIMDKLLNNAKRMLMYTSTTVSGIASYLGYETSSYFIRLFKKQTGYTPTEFRKKNKP